MIPGYMVREECKREKMRIRAAKRAWGFENKLRSGKGNVWARLCLEEIDTRARVGKGLSMWQKGRIK